MFTVYFALSFRQMFEIGGKGLVSNPTSGLKLNKSKE